MDDKQMRSLPMVPLRGMTVLPKEVVHFDVSRVRSIEAIQEAMAGDQQIFLTAQREIDIEEPSKEELYEMGTVATIKQVVKLPKKILRVLVTGESRARLNEIEKTEPYMQANVSEIEEYAFVEAEPVEQEAMARSLQELFMEYAMKNPKITKEIVEQIQKMTDLKKMVDEVAANVMFDYEDAQKILEELNPLGRYHLLVEKLANEINVMKFKEEIQGKVKANLDKHQKEYILREELKVIREELGEDNLSSDAEEFEKAVKELNAPDEVKEKLMKEIKRFKNAMVHPAENGVTRTYIETMLEMPWDKMSEDTIDLNYAKEIMDAEHYGLEKVKE